MNDTAELMQRTVPLTWNKPEWMLPEISTDDILIADTNGMVFQAEYNKEKGEFRSYTGFLVEPEFIDFWPICLNTQINNYGLQFTFNTGA